MYGDGNAQFGTLFMEKAGMTSALVVNVETSFQKDVQYFTTVKNG